MVVWGSAFLGLGSSVDGVLGLGFSADGLLDLLCEDIWGFKGLVLFILTYKNNPRKRTLHNIQSPARHLQNQDIQQ